MQIGLIGSGNMARALALGWGEPLLCTDSGSGRARSSLESSTLRGVRRKTFSAMPWMPPSSA